MHKGFTQNQPVGSINTKYLFSKSTGNNQYVRVSTGAYMVQFDPGDEERNIIQILSDGESKTIDEIYRELVEADVSAFRTTRRNALKSGDSFNVFSTS